MNKKYNIIVADPPWSFVDKLTMSDVKRGASSNYCTMKTSDIENISISNIIDTNAAVLALWTPSSLLEDGISIMKKWGFKQKQVWVWVKIKNDPFDNLLKLIYKTPLDIIKNKLNKNSLKEVVFNFDFNEILSFGMGKISRNVHEIALIGTCGNINSKIENKSERTVFFDKVMLHSQKTEILQNKLDIIFPDKSLNRLEMFGRRLRPNWDVIGNQSPSTMGEDINYSINNLLK